MPQPLAQIIYAVPPKHLQAENGTSHRLRTLRDALARHYHITEVNLLAAPLRRRERVGMLLATLFGLSNNLRYLGLAHRLPPAGPHQLTLLVGNYCACLTLVCRQRPLVLDLVDSLTLTDVRGLQSRWRWRPLLYLLQLPSSWLLEHWLRSHSGLQGVLITTEREQAWLQRLHGSWPRLQVVPNRISVQIVASQPAAPAAREFLQLAFVGSLDWWVNRVSAQNAMRIVQKFLQGPGIDRRVILNFYGSSSTLGLPRVSCPRLQIRTHGYVQSLEVVAKHNHAALLPNPVGRGFQNKLLTCVALGMPTIAHPSMSPHRQGSALLGPVLYCRSQVDYDKALLSLWESDGLGRETLRKACQNYLQQFFADGLINAALDQVLAPEPAAESDA